MSGLKYTFTCLIGYFLALFLFFNAQFVSHQQITTISNKTLLQPIEKSELKSNLNISTLQNSYQLQQPQSYPQVSQAILIIIDTLRYDYIKRFKFFNQTLKNHPKTTLLKKSLVGTPTMTTQRIQSMMTGSEIFTQTNILQMFLSSKKNTDNLISQLHRHNKTVKVFGDDTWVKLFGFQQKDAFVCDSTFNIRDYDSCDEIVYENLMKFVKTKDQVKKANITNQRQSKKVDNLLIAHFLAIDHIGHSTSSITASQIDEKMERMSIYFSHLIKVASPDTMFLITGDHGMRQDGNHGGNTPAEKESLFFAYYKPYELQSEHIDFRDRIKNFQDTFVNQVDLTPTLSLLLNVPLPVNSIGCPILQILPGSYEPYSKRIVYNTLEQYKTLVKFYDRDGQTKNQEVKNEQSLKCLANIQKEQQSLLRNESLIGFEQMIRTKQFIKTEIQLSRCLSERLSMVQPNQLTAVVSLFLMLVFLILITGKALFSQLISAINSPNLSKSSDFLSHMMIEQLGWICSLFVIYFSWYFIRNSSSVLLVVIVGLVVMVPKQCLKLKDKLKVVFWLVVLTQFEPDKINQYELNFMNFKIVENMVYGFNRILSIPHQTPNNHQTQLRQIKTGLHMFCLTVWLIVKLKHFMTELRVKAKRTKLRKNKQTTNLPVQSNFTYISIELLIIVYVGMLMSGLNYDKKIFGQSCLIWIRYFAFFVLLIKCCRQITNSSSVASDRQFNLLMGFSLIVGLENFLPLLIFLKCISTILASLFSSLPKPSSNLNKIPYPKFPQTQSPSGLKSSYLVGSQIILIAVICQYMWWILGNRYEYSSIDIKKSYIFSDQFSIYLNGIGMLLWFATPYIVALVMIDQKLSKLINYPLFLANQTQNKSRSQIQHHDDIEEQATHIADSQSSVQKTQIHQNPKDNSYKNATKQTSLYEQSILKFLFVLLGGVFSASVNLFYNNQKILFTIVYVPLMVLGIVKLFTITIMVVGFVLWRKKG